MKLSGKKKLMTEREDSFYALRIPQSATRNINTSEASPKAAGPVGNGGSRSGWLDESEGSSGRPYVYAHEVFSSVRTAFGFPPIYPLFLLVCQSWIRLGGLAI